MHSIKNTWKKSCHLILEHLLCPLKDRLSLARFLWGLFYLLQGFQILGWPTETERWITACAWMDGWKASWKTTTTSFTTSLNLVPNAHVCVYLMIHITKLQLQTTFPKPFYIRHSACIHRDPGVENLDVCTVCNPWDSNIQTMGINRGDNKYTPTLFNL